MKRRTFQIVLLVIAGAIVNVAVAWGCLLNHSSIKKTNPTMDDAGLSELWRKHAPANWPSLQFSFSGRATGVLSQSFAAIESSTEMIADHSDFTVVVVTLGWPMHTLTGGGYISRRAKKTAEQGWFDMFVASSNVKIIGMNFGSVFPTRPIWPGFAINTIFYAAILWGGWVVFFVPGKLKRTLRRRRGQCLACAYPVGTSNVCTECGGPVGKRPNVKTSKRPNEELTPNA